MPPLLLKVVFLQNHKNGIQIWTRTEGEDYSYLDKSVHLNGKVLTPEEDEEQLIMRRMRNSVDELRRGYRSIRFLNFLFSCLSQNAATGGLITECRGWRRRLKTARTSGRESSFLKRRYSREGVAHPYAMYLCSLDVEIDDHLVGKLGGN